MPNWHIEKLTFNDTKLQAPDKLVTNQPYWFFRYFSYPIDLHIIDIKSNNILHSLEKKIKFYIVQALLAYKVLRNYDIVISHGAQSGVFLALLMKLFGKQGCKHIIFDIGGMNGSRSAGFSTMLIRYAMKSKPYIICHSTNIIDNLKNNYPWLVTRSIYIPFGVGLYQYKIREVKITKNIFVFSGKKRDEELVVKAWEKVVDNNKDNGYRLQFVGTKKSHSLKNSDDINFLPYNEYIDKLESAAFVILPLKEYKYSYGQMSLLGSLALGKYVITTNVSGLSDYIRDCKSVKIINESNVDEMYSAICNFINSNIKDNLRTIPRKDVEENFTEEMMGIKISDFVYKVFNS